MSYSNITLTGAGSGYSTASVTIPVGAGGISGSNGTYSVTGAGGGYTIATGSSGSMWSSSYNYSPAVNITQAGINLANEADITLGNVSLKDTLQSIQDRLAILVPDPKKLEKFEALKQAYDHYKLLEALCSEEEEK